jgi:beta-N-acetylhexosaminidase
MKPVIFGIAGVVLTTEERAFFRDADPAGYILFKHNIQSRDQVRALTNDLRDASGRDDLPILIDQEGGRVARMGPPVWPDFPAGAQFGAAYGKAPMTAMEAVRANAEALALTLRDVGITVNCAPLLDVAQPDMHDMIGDRSFGTDPVLVASLGRAMLDGLAAGGCVGVIKHLPGYGRARCDSHLAMPVTDTDAKALAVDIAPFRMLARAAMGMTAHMIYTGWDADRCATLSPTIIAEVIRGQIGFDGLLMTDDIHMKALTGTPADIACEAIAAGCDIALDCWSRMDDMIAVVSALPDIALRSRDRLNRAVQDLQTPSDDGRAQALMAKRDTLLKMVA